MDNKTLNLINGLNKLQYYEFLRAAIGLKAFMDGEYTFKKITNENKNRVHLKVLGRLSGKDKRTVFCIDKGDYEEKKFSDTKGNGYTISEYFSSVDDKIINLLITSIYGERELREMGHRISSLLDDTLGKEILDNNKTEKCRFILGAGVNNDPELQIKTGNWNELIDKMRDEIKSIDAIKIEEIEDLVEFEKGICNTNYIAPEILKDFNEKAYYDLIHKNLYEEFDPDMLSIKNNSNLEDTSLYQIARVISERGEGQILTFNYDNFLEIVFNTNFSGTAYQTVYFGNAKKEESSINIIHPHGIYSYAGVRKGIILSTYEYFNGYYTSNRYARKQLNVQLKETNLLIGNSVSDYEEQKVFYTNFQNNPSSWHFMFLKKNESPHAWMDYYKMCYFTRMGIIPVFFDKFSDIPKYLKTL